MKLDNHNFSRFAATALLAATVAATGLASSARAGTVIDDWSKIKAPPPPKLHAVTVEPKTTALLMLDFVHAICNEKRRPRCVASLPAMEIAPEPRPCMAKAKSANPSWRASVSRAMHKERESIASAAPP